MSLLSAYYAIRLQETDKPDIYYVVRASKTGNCPTLNRLLAWRETVVFKRLVPIGIEGESVVYAITYGPRDDHQILLLETAMFLHPYGVVTSDPDCILFRISDDMTIEFFVSEGNANLTSQLLSMLVDGSLSSEIDKLLLNTN